MTERTSSTNRRRLLLGASLALPVVLAGCLGFSDAGRPPAHCSGDWSPGIEANEPTIAPGENATVHVVATNVSGFSYFDYGSQSAIDRWIRIESTSPAYDRSSDTSPPGYFWEECTHVEIEALVSVPPDTEPGEYAFGVHVVQNLSGPASTERNVTITVSEK